MNDTINVIGFWLILAILVIGSIVSEFLNHAELSGSLGTAAVLLFLFGRPS